MATSSLQVAQILADLQTLQNVDPQAALSLLNANKTISPSLIHRKSSRAVVSITLPVFNQDRFGRRLSASRISPSRSPYPSSSTSSTPPPPPPPRPTGNLIRLDSLSSSRSIRKPNSETTETPQHTPSLYETDEDLKRAKTLVSLYEMRGKVQQMGDVGLARAKARVDVIVARHAEVELADKERRARARYLQI